MADGRSLFQTAETKAAPELAASVMLRVAGKRFFCKCGANVFTKAGNNYRCNGCSRVWG